MRKHSTVVIASSALALGLALSGCGSSGGGSASSPSSSSPTATATESSTPSPSSTPSASTTTTASPTASPSESSTPSSSASQSSSASSSSSPSASGGAKGTEPSDIATIGLRGERYSTLASTDFAARMGGSFKGAAAQQFAALLAKKDSVMNQANSSVEPAQCKPLVMTVKISDPKKGYLFAAVDTKTTVSLVGVANSGESDAVGDFAAAAAKCPTIIMHVGSESAQMTYKTSRLTTASGQTYLRVDQVISPVGGAQGGQSLKSTGYIINGGSTYYIMDAPATMTPKQAGEILSRAAKASA